MNTEDTPGNMTCAPRMSLANGKIYLRQCEMLVRMCATKCKAWPENNDTWMDGWIDGREGTRREVRGGGKRRGKPLRQTSNNKTK